MGAGVTIVHSKGFGTLRMEREIIEVESMTAVKADISWHYTDKNGHRHRWSDGYPTLLEVEENPYWCEWCRDMHTDTRLECRICGETIVPKVVSDPGPHYIPGLTSYYLNDERITKDRFDELIAEAIR